MYKSFQDHFGVGGDSAEEDPESWKERLRVDTVRLSRFLSSAGQACRMHFTKHLVLDI
jgi:hypothetical protein